MLKRLERQEEINYESIELSGPAFCSPHVASHRFLGKLRKEHEGNSPFLLLIPLLLTEVERMQPLVLVDICCNHEW